MFTPVMQMMNFGITNEDDMPSLHRMIRSGNYDSVEQLLDTNIIDYRGNTSLHIAMMYGNNNIVKRLLAYDKSQASSINKLGQTPLMYGSSGGPLENIKVLYEYNVDPNIQDCDGNTALYHAVVCKRYDVIEFLLTHGAHPNISNNKNVTPLDFALLEQNFMGGYQMIIDLIMKYSLTTTKRSY